MVMRDDGQYFNKDSFIHSLFYEFDCDVCGGWCCLLFVVCLFVMISDEVKGLENSLIN